MKSHERVQSASRGEVVFGFTRFMQHFARWKEVREEAGVLFCEQTSAAQRKDCPKACTFTVFHTSLCRHFSLQMWSDDTFTHFFGFNPSPRVLTTL